MAYDKPDRYGRMLGLVINSDDKQINCEIIRAGAAWVYLKYNIDSELPSIEQEARQNSVDYGNRRTSSRRGNYDTIKNGAKQSVIDDEKRKKIFYFASYIMKFRGQKANDLHQKNYVQRAQYAACLLCHRPRSD
ncbi:thermonuclease family protein [Enterobacter asburiae]|uniref:thermonuclease family protein n=2 Tax=Enterobacter TaxID=547 RepID=UPI0011EE51E1|nr:hypothetical protein F0321_12020 [Enterobacter asburiae]KAA0534501.1 hypothetical protein F0320_06355 [Enterobacter dykesii]